MVVLDHPNPFLAAVLRRLAPRASSGGCPASSGPIRLVEFNSRRPFHPGRLHACLDLLLDGVIRTRGRPDWPARAARGF
ncbi:hypothetical protein MAHJHV33_48520 [Mycobacterium avium subsp. hominissuis]